MNKEQAQEIRHFQIYILYDLDDNAYYVGSAWGRAARERFSDHMTKRNGAVRRIKERVALGHEFKMKVVEDGDGAWSTAHEREEWWIHCCLTADPDRQIININLYPSRSNRIPMSEEAKAKRSAELKGKPRPGGTPWLIGRSPASKGKKSPKISASKMGHSVSEETRAKISATTTGRTRDFTEEHCQHLSDAWNRLTPEEQSERVTKITAGIRKQTKWQCDECGHVTNRGPLVMHMRGTGHQGMTKTDLRENVAIAPSPSHQPKHPNQYQCNECDFKSSYRSVSIHQQSRFSGHVGRTEIPPSSG